MNTKALKKLNYSMTLISTASEGKNYGCMINSLHQVTSAAPQKFTLALNKDSATGAAISKSGILAATLLSMDCPEEIINEFGYKSGRAVDKFASFPFETDAQGCPFLRENMVARLAFKVVETVEIGTHNLYILELTDCETLADGDCMTIKEFEKRDIDVPPVAPVYHQLEANAGWKCSVCGYVRLDETIPDDFICPICRAPRDKFVKQ